METVLIAGATGLIGKQLSNKLQINGYKVIYLSRTTSSNPSFPTYLWNINEQSIDDNAILQADYIINLAGEGIANKRWTNKRKKEIIDSRVKAAQLMYDGLKRNQKQLKAYISASAIGFYGAITSDTIFKEEDKAASDFLGDCCMQWENAANRISDFSERTIILRIGTVLSKDGGALPKISLPIKYNAGAIISTGKQYMPWIHIDDLTSLFVHAIEQKKTHGIYNAVAPEHITNQQLTKNITDVLHKKLLPIKVPSLFLKLLLGEMAELLTEGSRVSSQKIAETGFKFNYADIKSAINKELE